MFLAIGPYQIILITISLIIPICILFFVGFFIGKRIGFKKGIEASQTDDTSNINLK